MLKIYVVNSAQVPDGTMNVNELVRLANRKAKELAELMRGTCELSGYYSEEIDSGVETSSRAWQ